jgi:hypothetical protein
MRGERERERKRERERERERASCVVESEWIRISRIH